MIYCTQEDIFSPRRVFLWLLSAFKAGFINSTGFLIVGDYLSHVSGYGTRVGIAVGHEAYAFGFELLMIPVFFILGGFLTALILESSRGRYPPYYIVQIIITIIIAAIVYTGEMNYFILGNGFNSDEDYTPVEFAVAAGLCFVCGMKNSLVSWTTFGKLKVTHLTGLSTDIAINLLHTLGIKKENLRFSEPRSVNYIRIGILMSFATGAFSCAALFPELGLRSLYIILALSIFMSVISLADAAKHLRSEKQANSSR